MLSVKWINDWK